MPLSLFALLVYEHSSTGTVEKKLSYIHLALLYNAGLKSLRQIDYGLLKLKFDFKQPVISKYKLNYQLSHYTNMFS